MALMCVNKNIYNNLRKKYCYFPFYCIKTSDFINIENYLTCEKTFCILPAHLFFEHEPEYQEKCYLNKQPFTVDINLYDRFMFQLCFFVSVDKLKRVDYLNIKIQNKVSDINTNAILTDEEKQHIINFKNIIKHRSLKKDVRISFNSLRAVYSGQPLFSNVLFIAHLLCLMHEPYSFVGEMLRKIDSSMTLNNIFISSTIKRQYIKDAPKNIDWQTLKSVQNLRKDIAKKLEEDKFFTAWGNSFNPDEYSKFMTEIKKIKNL
ncbi:MAG TPA: hypothetical protein VL201_02125 [Patescibacteria group bacterium]|jgi:hypothetical protein|nr:hypothetical protein [Patescibacteria group bacterium]